MTQHFIIEEHVLPGQHIRGYYNALKTHQEDVVEIAIKHYLPKEAAPPTTSLPSITIVAGHGNGFPKEMYEPVWDDLFEITQAHGFHISGIWFADNAHQGESGF
ncbi:MAG: hypothetical protein M1828_004510 [Chrysothrix sp. TS-e1954]|nr:MAG: hypothetical protein M1828_004510 [Chrysothrix sp. TS-e1954]